MKVLAQAPQPIIMCYHSVSDGKVVKKLYQEFTPTSVFTSGKNLQSYNFEKSLDNFGGSFSFTVKEDVDVDGTLFMDKVQPLDIIVISENGTEQKIDFIGVVTTVSIGGIASNLNKVVTVSGKSIEWLFEFYNINADVKCVVINNEAANATLKLDLAEHGGEEGISIKDIVIGSYKMFENQVNGFNTQSVSNFVIGQIIKQWYGDIEEFVIADDKSFQYPISSNLFTNGKINIINFLKQLLPPPIYEIFGIINDNNKPVLKFREAPFDNPKTKFYIDPVVLTDFTLTRSCDEVYTAFMPYIEGSSMSPDFYMNLEAAKAIAKGYPALIGDEEKIKIYGYQLLTCSFVGYNENPENPSKPGFEDDKLRDLVEKLKKWFSKLDEMYSGDFTIVNKLTEKHAKIGDWIKFAKGCFYVVSEKHTWTYGDNPMINYQVTRGGEYLQGNFEPLKKLSAAYREFE